MKIDRVLVNGTIVTPEGRFEGDIGIKDGRIATISECGEDYIGSEIIDVVGKFILPGLIDAHIQFQDPGFTHREDFEHGTAACAVGGITTAISHPMNDPAVVDVASYQANLDAYSGRGIVDYGLHGGGTADNIQEVEALWTQTGATAVKMFMCFSVKEFPFVRDDAMFDILERLARRGGFAIIHAENEELIRLKESGNSRRRDERIRWRTTNRDPIMSRSRPSAAPSLCLKRQAPRRSSPMSPRPRLLRRSKRRAEKASGSGLSPARIFSLLSGRIWYA